MRIYELLNPRSILLGVTVAIFVYLLLMMIGMYEELGIILTSGLYTFWLKLKIIIVMLSYPFGQLTALSVFASAVVAVLVGVQVMFIYYIRRAQGKAQVRSGTTASLTSSVLVALGMGCSACGSVIFLSILSIFGVTVGAALAEWITGVLLIAAIVILVYTNYRLYKYAQHPLVCEI